MTRPDRPWWSAYAAALFFGSYVVTAIAGKTIEASLMERGIIGQEGDWGTFILFLLFAIVGAVLVWLVPRNVVSWLFCGVVLLAMGSFVTWNYAEYGARVEPLPAMRYAAWLGSWAWFPTLAIIGTYLPLLFPTGTFVSPRWRWVAYVTSLGLLCLCAPLAFTPGNLDGIPLENPFGIAALVPLFPILEPLGAGLLLISVLLSVASALVRFKRSRGDERLQLKWFVLGLGVMVSWVLLSTLIPGLEESIPDTIGNIIFAVVASLVPVTAAVAIVKYRLYSIDTVINRVLVYGLLTAVLVGVYLAIIVGLQIVLEPVTRQSDLAVAISTLAAAAAFRPMRDRVQRFIDRRFYRHKYDAAKLLGGFVGRLRNEVDLDAVHSEVIVVVERTMQPRRVSLWIGPIRPMSPEVGSP